MEWTDNVQFLCWHGRRSSHRLTLTMKFMQWQWENMSCINLTPTHKTQTIMWINRCWAESVRLWWAALNGCVCNTIALKRVSYRYTCYTSYTLYSSVHSSPWIYKFIPLPLHICVHNFCFICSDNLNLFNVGLGFVSLSPPPRVFSASHKPNEEGHRVRFPSKYSLRSHLQQLSPLVITFFREGLSNLLLLFFIYFCPSGLFFLERIAYSISTNKQTIRRQ